MSWPGADAQPVPGPTNRRGGVPFLASGDTKNQWKIKICNRSMDDFDGKIYEISTGSFSNCESLPESTPTT